MENDLIFTLLIVIDLALIVTSVVLHGLGLYLILKFEKRRRKNLHTILIHLSATEIVTQVCRLGAGGYFYNYEQPDEYVGYQVLRTFTIHSWCVSYIFVMMVVALDPLLIVTLKTNYKKYVHRKNLNILLMCCWFVGIVNGSISFSMSYEKREEISSTYIFPIIASVFLMFSILSYGMIYKHIKYDSKMNNNNNSANNVNQRNHSTATATKRPGLKFRVPMLIILTFFLFIASPSVVQFIFVKKLTKNFLLCLGISFNAGFICDALIYLFFHPATKKLLYSHIPCCHERNIANLNEASVKDACSPPIIRVKKQME